jgi:AcrR family transcriptional regulator
MSVITRKQREIQEREKKLIQIGRKLLLEQGLHGLKLDRVAEIAEYSRGTIYQHFQSKEDLLAAMAIESAQNRFELFERASQFPGLTREKIVAILVADEIFDRSEPQYYRSEFIINLADLLKRAAPENRAKLTEVDNKGLAIAPIIIEDAIRSGDIPPGISSRHIMFALMTMLIGSHVSSYEETEVINSTVKIGDRFETLRDCVATLLDGFGWRPLSTEWDYSKTVERVRSELFAEESRKLFATS